MRNMWKSISNFRSVVYTKYIEKYVNFIDKNNLLESKKLSKTKKSQTTPENEAYFNNCYKLFKVELKFFSMRDKLLLEKRKMFEENQLVRYEKEVEKASKKQDKRNDSRMVVKGKEKKLKQKK